MSNVAGSLRKGGGKLKSGFGSFKTQMTTTQAERDAEERKEAYLRKQQQANDRKNMQEAASRIKETQAIESGLHEDLEKLNEMRQDYDEGNDEIDAELNALLVGMQGDTGMADIAALLGDSLVAPDLGDLSSKRASAPAGTYDDKAPSGSSNRPASAYQGVTSSAPPSKPSTPLPSGQPPAKPKTPPATRPRKTNSKGSSLQNSSMTMDTTHEDHAVDDDYEKNLINEMRGKLNTEKKAQQQAEEEKKRKENEYDTIRKLEEMAKVKREQKEEEERQKRAAENHNREIREKQVAEERRRKEEQRLAEQRRQQQEKELKDREEARLAKEKEIQERERKALQEREQARVKKEQELLAREQELKRLEEEQIQREMEERQKYEHELRVRELETKERELQEREQRLLAEKERELQEREERLRQKEAEIQQMANRTPPSTRPKPKPPIIPNKPTSFGSNDSLNRTFKPPPKPTVKPTVKPTISGGRPGLPTKPKPTSTPPSKPAAAPAETFGPFTYDELVNKRSELIKNPAFQVTKIESYLSLDEFQRIFNMPYADYEKIPQWKKNKLKQQVDLF